MSESDARRKKLNQETARLPWHELQRHFAAGSVVWVSNELDLIEVALQFSFDNKTLVQSWLSQGQVAKASDEQAQNWLEQDAQLWATVVPPFVLVQEHKPGEKTAH